MNRRKTAGEQSLKAASDNSRYDPLEIAHAMTHDIYDQLMLCAKNHEQIFDEQKYCVVLVRAGDPLIKGIKRHKYAAFLHLPSPRPEQTCFLFNKITQKLKRLWSLPNAKLMAAISECQFVLPEWQLTKGWCDAFFDGKFWEHIRKQHNIKMLSEIEYLNANREKLIQAGCQEVNTPITEAFDFSKISINKIVDTKTAILEQ